MWSYLKDCVMLSCKVDLKQDLTYMSRHQENTKATENKLWDCH